MCQFAQSHGTDQPASSNAPITIPSLVPENKVCQKAYTFAASHLSPAILNHSIRVYLYAKHIDKRPSPFTNSPSSNWNTILFVASILHDIATIERFNGPDRFEICGADAAADFLKQNAPEITEAERQDVWTAIACHTTPGISERISPLARLLRLGVLTDFNRPGIRVEMETVDLCSDTEKNFARLEIERVLGDAVVALVLSKAEGSERSQKAPNNSWPGSLWKGYLEMQKEGVEGVNKYF